MKEPTAMRLAFARAMPALFHVESVAALVSSALRRGVGLTTRKQMWSVTRGGR